MVFFIIYLCFIDFIPFFISLTIFSLFLTFYYRKFQTGKHLEKLYNASSSIHYRFNSYQIPLPPKYFEGNPSHIISSIIVQYVSIKRNFRNITKYNDHT